MYLKQNDGHIYNMVKISDKDEKNIILEADNGLEYSYNKDEKKLKSLSIMKGYITDCIIMPRSHESDLEYWKYETFAMMKIIDKQFEGIRNLSFNKDLDYGCLFGVLSQTDNRIIL